MTTYGEALTRARIALSTAGIEAASLDARLLMADAADLDSAALVACSGDTLPPLVAGRFDDHIKRRLSGVPVARIRGEKEFWGLSFALSDATLVPRPETETLVEAVLAAAKGRFADTLTICDLGTGSGAIIVALLSELRQAHGTATDISEAALAMARRNAERHGVAARVRFHSGDFAEGPSGPFDVVVSNPPYVESGAIAGLAPEVRDHDPRLALDGGPDGLAAYRTIASRARNLLAPGGLLALEVGFNQAERIAALCQEHGLTSVAMYCDLAGHRRVVTAICETSEGRRNRRKKRLEMSPYRASVDLRTRAEARELASLSGRKRTNAAKAGPLASSMPRRVDLPFERSAERGRGMQRRDPL